MKLQTQFNTRMMNKDYNDRASQKKAEIWPQNSVAISFYN